MTENNNHTNTNISSTNHLFYSTYIHTTTYNTSMNQAESKKYNDDILIAEIMAQIVVVVLFLMCLYCVVVRWCLKRYGQLHVPDDDNEQRFEMQRRRVPSMSK